MLGVWPSQMRSQKLNLGLLHGWWRLNCLSHHLLPSRVCISRTVECWVESGHREVGYGSPGVISAATANTSLGFLWPEWAVQNASANAWLADKKPIAQPLVQYQIFSSGKQRKMFRFRFLPLQQAGMFLWERGAAGEMSVVIGGKGGIPESASSRKGTGLLLKCVCSKEKDVGQLWQSRYAKAT